MSQRGFSWVSMAWPLLVLALFLGAPLSSAHGFTLQVVTSDGTPVSGFRWLVEEDTTHAVVPGVKVPNPLAVDIHRSYAPVVAKGHSDDATAVVNVPSNKRYAVSVLPDAGFTMSGTNVAVGQNSVRVVVNAHNLPTAQISIFVFEDHDPINNGPDLPQFGLGGTEVGLPGFSVLLADNAGQVSQDAFGNPLGTTYLQDAEGNFLFDAEGNPQVDQIGNGVIVTDADGMAEIKYILPGKYGVQLVAPAGSNWVQTTTIEGTPTIDAWVKADEPPLLVEFGPAFNHIFMGFVDRSQLPWALNPPVPGEGETFGSISGQIVGVHTTKPPTLVPFPGAPVEECFVGLNDTTAATDKGLVAVACGPEGAFTIPNVPPGTYQLVVWDRPLDYIFHFATVTVPPEGGPVDLGQVPVFAWFGTLEGTAFFDANENGFPDPGEAPLAEQNVNLRFRDGSIYKFQPTDGLGEYSFSEVFPFFKWLVAEIDFARFKATGATIVVDDGGEIPGVAWPADGKRTPQPQAEINPNTGDNLSRTEAEDGLTAPVLLEGMMLFAGQNTRIDWGKTMYAAGQNGGISGVVFYDVTRAEDDPALGLGEEWQPGIPRVTVNLYSDVNNDGVIDDVNANGLPTRADVDNHPFGNFPGPEDIDRNGNGIFNAGDAINIASTDSWDDNLPTGCIQELPIINGQPATECYDNFGTWNQVRPAVFDGGYAFTSYFPGGIDSGSTEVDGLPAGTYIVEMVPPPGYELVKEEDKNVDFGEPPTPSPLILPPACVGDPHLVPAELTLFPGVPAAFAGQTRPLCDRKQVLLAEGANAAADFFLFTEVPKAARGVGTITNDLAAEQDPNNPNLGEKAAPRWLPISFKDYKGNELARTYSDEFGAYNVLLPSTYSINAPTPTGVAPQMISICLNDPGPIPDPNNPGSTIIDPFFNFNFSNVCYTLDFWPGKTTYLDTPVIPVAAFTANPNIILDVQPVDGTPVIASVTGPNGGPLVCTDGDVLTITSAGQQQVPNPDYDGTDPASPTLVTRDFGFGGATGQVWLDGTRLSILSWSAQTIQVRVPLALQPGGTLTVVRGDNGTETQTGVRLQVGDCGNVVMVSAGQSIQAAIDAAPAGALVLVGPGTYRENLVIWKNVRLQGAGSGGTVIDALPVPSARLTAWKEYVQGLLDSGATSLLPGQDPLTLLNVDTAPGILVLVEDGVFSQAAPGLIDGFTIRGAANGGGIYVNAFAHYLTVSNNVITNNLGQFGGGIRLGTPAFVSGNDHVTLRGNRIVQNGGVNGGSGISLFPGTDDYLIVDNVISGNFSRQNGGGIYHAGLSERGRIEGNTIAFNEVFYGSEVGGDGGGIYIAGAPGGPGSGSVSVIGNLIQGNLAGSGQGGGIRALEVNGTDLTYTLEILNNVIVNNVAALAGGGIALHRAFNTTITNNTVAHNDSTATAADAFVAGNLTESVPQPAGIVSSAHTEAGEFSNPVLINNIVEGNRSFFRDATLNGGLGGLRPASEHSSGTFTADFWDLGVTGAAAALNPDNCLLTSLVGMGGENYADGTNLAATPAATGFASGYFNELLSAAAGDEGGNFVNISFTPLSITAGNYHLVLGSPAIDAGAVNDTVVFPALAADFDGQARPNPNTGVVDIGADEFYHLTLVGTFRQGMWFLDNGNGQWNAGIDTVVANFGAPTDKPVAGDMDGDGLSEIGVFRPATGQWFFDLDRSVSWSGCGPDLCLPQFGAPGDIPVTGDWDGNGTKVGVYRQGQWFLDNGNGQWEVGTDTFVANFGTPTDKPVTGDMDGDGTTEIGVYRPGTGQWFFDLDHSGSWSGCGPDLCLSGFGAPGDIPVTGDWDGDGSYQVGTYRQGRWFLDNGNGQWDGAGVDTVYGNFGAPTDIPVTGFWQ